MKYEIHTIRVGINACYLVKGENGYILIDTGMPYLGKKITRYMEKNSIPYAEIKLIILTHTDFDHAGAAYYLNSLTGADILVHENEQERLEHGTFYWPPGATLYGRITRFLVKPLAQTLKLTPVKAGRIMKEDIVSLEEYGIKGKVVHTPGHTEGSISVILDSGEAFAGCLAHNFFLFTLKPKLPIYAQDHETIKESWKILIEMGASEIYPGHGKHFNIDRIRPCL